MSNLVLTFAPSFDYRTTKTEMVQETTISALKSDPGTRKAIRNVIKVTQSRPIQRFILVKEIVVEKYRDTNSLVVETGVY